MPSPPRSLVQFVLQHVQVKKNLCSRQKFGTGYTLPPRVVPDYNIIFMAAGEVVWVIEGVDHVLGPGRMALVPPAVAHHGYSRSDEMCLLSYHADVTLPGGQNVFDLLIPPLSQDVIPGSRLDGYLRQAGEEHDRPDPMDANLMLRSWVELIFTELVRDNFERGLLDYRETDPVVVDVLESLLGRVSEPTTLEELAQFAGYSPQHLNRVFRRALGVTPLQYLTRLRMQRASELLTEGRLTVRAIARSVSFEDPYYFSRLFKQHTGESPAAYRERTGSESPSLHSDAPFPPPPGSG